MEGRITAMDILIIFIMSRIMVAAVCSGLYMTLRWPWPIFKVLGEWKSIESYIFLSWMWVDWSFALVALTPRREAGDVWCLPPVWNLRAVIWFHFTTSSLVLLSSPITLSVLFFFLPAGPFSWTLSREFFNIFREEIGFFVWLLFSS